MADTWHTKTALGFKIFLVQLILVLAPQVMNTTKLLTVFESFDDESAALESFSESD